MTEKKSNGAGKFFLGAALGAIAGAVASKFVSTKKENECGCDEDCDCGCKEDGGCEKEEESVAEEKPTKK